MIIIIAAAELSLTADDANALTSGDTQALIDLQLRVVAAMEVYEADKRD